MKTAFVTGATAGIGLATVRTLVANGWRCVATGRRQERLDALVAELGADKVHAVCFDVRDTAALDAALRGDVDAAIAPLLSVPGNSSRNSCIGAAVLQTSRGVASTLAPGHHQQQPRQDRPDHLTISDQFLDERSID